MQHRTLVAAAVVAGLTVTTGAIALGANLTSVSGETTKVTPASEVVQDGASPTPTTIVTLIQEATDQSTVSSTGSDDTQSTAASSSSSESESELEREDSTDSTRSADDPGGHGQGDRDD